MHLLVWFLLLIGHTLPHLSNFWSHLGNWNLFLVVLGHLLDLGGHEEHPGTLWSLGENDVLTILPLGVSLLLMRFLAFDGEESFL